MKKKMSKILLVLLTSIFVTGCSLDLKSDKPIENGMIQKDGVAIEMLLDDWKRTGHVN